LSAPCARDPCSISVPHVLSLKCSARHFISPVKPDPHLTDTRSACPP
jgi:hypothetical protein